MEKLSELIPMVEFPLARENRKLVELPLKEYSLKGQLMLSSTTDARHKEHLLQSRHKDYINQKRKLSTGSFYGSALLHSIFRVVLEQFSKKQEPQFWENLEVGLQDISNHEERDELFKEILKEYCPNPLLDKKNDQWLQEPKWRQLALEQMVLLQLLSENPAVVELQPLIGYKKWQNHKGFGKIIKCLEALMKTSGTLGPNKMAPMDFLRMPINHSPILVEQLKYIRENWVDFLEEWLQLLLQGLDLISEESQVRLPGPGPAEGVDFSFLEDDQARYSPDSGWMPRVILLAKNALVWLFQLSKKYNREISSLSDIPDEELDFLANCGFTGLWLIGIWERSPASQHIKKLCGNPEAEASAYSLYHYHIAHKLGGEEAMAILKERCKLRGIRMASDMVPNHCGIDSDWIRNKPQWFIQREDNPFPQYNYNGPNLSEDPSMEVYLEDHYYDQSDCAVTFKRIDKNTGKVSYIYHGNDGTTMPWNDTAQIDFLNPQAREAVIQQILQVARHFPIIRFDAAMVLARKHIRRLWYPKPGEGGAIPSRSQSALDDMDFHKAMPEEFWREVVQRVAEECPDTLLLAEAFWMMEGYFVRNLGMHRVYNSAFMNMVKDEKNDEFRQLIKKTLDYDPEILKRYVNFMSNPDEDTAEEQFGRGDKYFGSLMLMLTLPGLPMLGHGQLEGYREKYGMEYSRAYYDEEPDEELLSRHQREIYPIMKQRQMFSDAAMFQLYDIPDSHGSVQEHIYAYSNRHQGKNSLFIYNNRMDEAQGTVHMAYGHKYSVGSLMGCQNHSSHFLIFHEHRCNLWFIRNSSEIFNKGLYFHVPGYGYQLFTKFREVQDGPDRLYQAICNELNGRGTPSIEQAILDHSLKPLYSALGGYLNQRNLDALSDALFDKKGKLHQVFQQDKDIKQWFKRIQSKLGNKSRSMPSVGRFKRTLRRSLRRWHNITAQHPLPGSMETRRENAELLALWLLICPLQKISGMSGDVMLTKWDIITQLKQRRTNPQEPWIPYNSSALLKALFRMRHWHKNNDLLGQLSKLFDDPLFQEICGVNIYDNILWFNQQGFEEISSWLFIMARLEQRNLLFIGWIKRKRLWKALDRWITKYQESGFRVQHMRTHHK